ncbi:DoxX family protein [Polaromonas sp. JS666]|uniref:DoxX family protein n=1 Tax=Polaromonas sp. (strain JS666 / ATCC BAA-500) TaxID=296591 RepID=UPI0000D5B34E|nr:DoxX family protein [Polaromonas sp. JS666]ABE42311.1 DoxX [Polaromonas sp. JS666]
MQNTLSTVDLVILATRLTYGASSVFHGYSKLRGGPKQFAAAWGLPPPVAYVVVFTQIICGALFAAGVLTAYAGLGLMMIAAGALGAMLKRGAPFAAPGKLGWDYPLMHLIVPLVLVVIGPGRYSLQALVN